MKRERHFGRPSNLAACELELSNIQKAISQTIGRQRGHIVYCLEGEFITEQENGEKTVLKKGMTYVVSDDLSSHRSIAEKRREIVNY